MRECDKPSNRAAPMPACGTSEFRSLCEVHDCLARVIAVMNHPLNTAVLRPFAAEHEGDVVAMLRCVKDHITPMLRWKIGPHGTSVRMKALRVWYGSNDETWVQDTVAQGESLAGGMVE